MNRQYRKYIIFDSKGGVRVMSTIRGLRYDEVAYSLNVSVPDSWGKVAGEINIILPEAKAANVRLGTEPIRPEEEE